MSTSGAHATDDFYTRVLLRVLAWPTVKWLIMDLPLRLGSVSLHVCITHTYVLPYIMSVSVCVCSLFMFLHESINGLP